MKNTIKVLGIIAIIAIIGFLSACSNGDTPTVEHTHAWGDWTVTKEATCSAKGEETKVCTLDPSHKETRETAIDPDAHDWEQLEGTAPTCTTEGNGKRKCKLCGEEESGVLPALGHDWGEWVETKAPTETEDGEEERICAHDATHKETRAKAALNHTHDYGDWFINTPATCTADGESRRVCKLNENHFETAVIEKLGHDWGDLVVTAATCTAIGKETKKCKRCELEESDVLPIDQNAHNYQWQAITPASFIKEGIETEICSHNPLHTRDTRTSNPKPITTALEWNEAVTAISGGGNDETYDINVTGEFSIPGYSSTSPTFGNVTDITVNIKGSGTITLASNSTGQLLYIGENQTISLKETHLVGHSANNTSLVYVYGGRLRGSTFNMTGGTISGNTASIGGGVYVGVEGTFNMSGGTILNNISTINNTTYGGGGVFLVGGTFNMSGTAVIRDNEAIRGGGVFLYLESDTTTFNMTGGTISGNTSTNNGGGICTGTMVGVSGNIRTYINITDGIITGNTALLGGGIRTYTRCTINLLSLDLVIGNTCTATSLPVHQILCEGGQREVYINGVKQATREDENYEW